MTGIKSETLQKELIRAIENQDDGRVETLLAQGGLDLDASIDGNGGTYLLKAVQDGTNEAVGLLLHAGACPNKADTYGASPMHSAARSGVSTKMEALLSAGADLNPQDVSGETPLFKAAIYKRDDYVKQLLDYGANSEALDGEGKTAADILPESATELRDRIRNNVSPPTCDMRGDLDKASLLARNDKNLCALDAGATWKRPQHMLGQLAAQGQHFTRDEMLTAGKDGKPYLQRAIENGAGRKILAHLNAHGEQLQPQDLLVDGAPSTLLNAAIKHHAVGALFSRDAWHGRSPDQMTAVYRAMPEEGQAQVKNYFSLRTQLNETQVLRDAGRGR